DGYDADYMLRKLNEEYTEWNLEMNLNKTECLVMGGNGTNLIMEYGATEKNCSKYRYLGSWISKEGGSEEDINNKLIKGKIAIRQLNSVI
ncbi:hypothetical protein HHI36_014413, partial [Cryptolaemus montrouzieri]